MDPGAEWMWGMLPRAPGTETCQEQIQEKMDWSLLVMGTH